MQRLHVAHVNRFYLCQRCGAVREDVCDDIGAITRQVWHDSSDDLSSDVARQEAARVLEIVRTEQLEFSGILS